MHIQLNQLKKLLLKPGNIALLSTSILIVIIIINLLSEKHNQQSGFPDNPENVISPLNRIEPNKQPVSFDLKRLSVSQLLNMLFLMFKWDNLFDIFLFNDKYVLPKNTINEYSLSVLSKKLKQQNIFYPGSSDALLKEYGNLIKEECKYYKLDWRLILAMIKQESAFTPDAVSHAGAFGFMQIMPGTGSMLEQALQIEDYHSPENNLRAGIYYYATLVARYHQAGDTNKYKFALAAYNCGSGHVEDAMTMSYYFRDNYLDWNVVSDYLTKLTQQSDSLHKLIWKGKPPAGNFSNWKEPVNYVSKIIFYWEQYKLLYPEPEDKLKKKRKKK